MKSHPNRWDFFYPNFILLSFAYPRIKLMDWIESFIDYLAVEKKYSQHTVISYSKDLNDFNLFLRDSYGTLQYSEVNYGIIRQWIVSLVEQGLDNRSINRKTSALNSFFKFIQRAGTINSNPMVLHKALKVKKSKQMPFSKEEVYSVLDMLKEEGSSFENIRNQLIVELFYATGMRRAELVNLKLTDLQLENGVLKVLGKRNKERFIPLINVVRDRFKTYLTFRNELETIKDGEYIFLTAKGTKIYDTLVYRVINDYFSNASTKAKCSPHILRHSFATHLLNEGANLNAVKELLGHSSLAATQVYTHNSIAELKKVHFKSHPRQDS